MSRPVLRGLILDGRARRPYIERMTIGFFFWLLMVLWLVFGILVPNWNTWGWPFGGGVLLWIILALLGWKTFGPMLHG